MAINTGLYWKLAYNMAYIIGHSPIIVFCQKEESQCFAFEVHLVCWSGYVDLLPAQNNYPLGKLNQATDVTSAVAVT